MAQTYEDQPLSIGEIRVDKTHKASDWAPRDALIDMLRQIDSGAIKVDNLVVAWSGEEGGEKISSYSNACQSMHLTIGVLARALHVFQCGLDAS